MAAANWIIEHEDAIHYITAGGAFSNVPLPWFSSALTEVVAKIVSEGVDVEMELSENQPSDPNFAIVNRRFILTRTTRFEGIGYDRRVEIMEWAVQSGYKISNQAQGNGWWTLDIPVTRRTPWVLLNMRAWEVDD